MDDRFSLLYLEPGEIYFTDIAVTFCQNPDAKVQRVSSPHKRRTSSTKKQETDNLSGKKMRH